MTGWQDQGCQVLIGKWFSIALDIYGCCCAVPKLSLVIQPLREYSEGDLDIVMGNKPWKVLHELDHFLHGLF